MIRIAIIVGSTRPGRKAEPVARWVHDLAAERGDATFELVDLADYDLPHLDEPVPAAMGADYSRPHSRAWAATIASFDGYVFVTPEYNHSTSGVLKNAIDFLYVEWHNKAAGFVGYGLNGGTRAVEHLRLVMGELQVADVRQQVALSVFTDFDDMEAGLRPADHHQVTLHTMLDQLIAWSGALKSLRTAEEPALAGARP
jgi:NAD(P)H-dependent FMN reductase